MDYIEKTLSNKLKTLFINHSGSPAATVQIWFRAGSALEVTENEGIAHFLEHMFFKGTKARPGSKIAFEVETFGGEINAFTSFDYTCYYINTPQDKIKNAIEILLDMVSDPEFKETEMLPEREVVFEEYRRSIDNSNHFMFNKLQEASFEGSYSHPILGNENTIKNFSVKQLQAFRNQFYNLSNTMLVVGGDLSSETQNIESLTNLIEKFKLPEGPKSKFPVFNLKKNPGIQIHHKEVGMSTLSICVQAPAYSSTPAASEDLAINCLGFGETSHLYKNLVLKETICNSASASSMFMADGGAHFFRFILPAENLPKMADQFLKTISNCLKNGIHKDEIKKIKNQYISSKVYEMESIESFAFSLGHSYAQGGSILTEEEFINRIRNTNATQVNESLRRIFSDEFHLHLQLPTGFKKTAAAHNALKKIEKGLKEFSKNLKKEDKPKNKIQYSKFDKEAKLIELIPGVELFYRHNPITPTFVFQAYLRGGLTEENAKNNGIYHLLSTTLAKGYKGKKYDEMKTQLENLSSSLYGFAGKNAYGLLMHGLSEHFDELAPLFSGSLLAPTFLPKFIKHEKDIAERLLKNHKEDPVKQCFKIAQKIFFDTHPYALNPLSDGKNIKKITPIQIAKLHSDNLKKKKILLTYSGSHSLSEVLHQVNKMVLNLKARENKGPEFKRYTPQKNSAQHVKFDREQTQIFFGIPTGNYKEKENLYLKLLSTHLSGQSSELFVEVRDKQGLCYTAQPVHHSALEGGYFGIYMASGHDKVEAAIDAIEKMIERIKNEGLNLDQFNRIKEMIKGQSMMNVQTNEDYANIYSVSIRQNQGLDYYHNTNNEIENLNYDEFQKGLKKVLSKKWSTVTVGR